MDVKNCFVKIIHQIDKHDTSQCTVFFMIQVINKMAYF